MKNVVDAPQNDDLPLLEASRRGGTRPVSAQQGRGWSRLGRRGPKRPLAGRRICNDDILGRVQQVICFAFHDSKVLLQTIERAREMRKIVTLFFLD